MDLLLVLIATATFPVACLGFVLWMGRIEDSIPTAVRRATRSPDPAPVLAIPVRPVAGPVTIPTQRSGDADAGRDLGHAGRRGDAGRDLGHPVPGRWPGPTGARRP